MAIFFFRFRPFLLVILFTILISHSEAQSIYPAGLKSYAAQLHIHGLSNHNGSVFPACMQYQSFFSDTTNTPILWWTDHREVYAQNVTNEFSFVNGVYDSTTNIIGGLSGSISKPIKWVGYTNGGTISVGLTDSSVTVGMADSNSTAYQYIYFSPEGTKGSLKGTRNWVRPLTSQPKLSLDITPHGIDTTDNTQAQLIILMSYHFYDGAQNQQSITYNFVSDSLPYSRTLLDSFTLVVNVPVIDSVINHVVLDLAADGSFLKDGVDNTTNDYRLLAQSKNYKTISAEFANITITSSDSVAYSQYLIQQALATSYGVRYGISEYLGAEWTDDNHLNGYLPDSATNRTCLYIDNNIAQGPKFFVNNVHASGGIASFNHPFGSAGAIQSQAIQDYRTDTIAQFLLNDTAFGCDIIEVGYEDRGGADLDHHLKLWDILTANQLYLYGDGVTDSHGGTWFTPTNNFITWIWAADTTPEKLIDGLKAGKSFFGDHLFYTGSKFFFKVANATMGDRVPAMYRSAPAEVEISNLPANSEFRITQGLIQPGLIVNYLFKDSVFDPTNPPCISLTSPCFIRISIYNSENPVLFSNPIVFTTGASPTDSTLCDTSPIPVIEKDANNFVVFPNPTNGQLILRANCKTKKQYKISVYNTAGKFVKYLGNHKLVPGSNDIKFDLSTLSNGNYMLLLESINLKTSLPFEISN